MRWPRGVSWPWEPSSCSDRERACLRGAPLPVTLLPLMAALMLCPEVSLGKGTRESVEVTVEADGGFRARGAFQIAAGPPVVQAILTDYEKWPELFETNLRIATVDREGDRVVVELFIQHLLLFREQRLRCENWELPGGGLRTTRLEGDFRRYDRTWKIRSEENGVQTRAEFELLIEVDTWAPDWLVAWSLRKELETHFRRVKEKAEKRKGLDLGGEHELNKLGFLEPLLDHRRQVEPLFNSSNVVQVGPGRRMRRHKQAAAVLVRFDGRFKGSDLLGLFHDFDFIHPNERAKNR